ncbi:MAG TPA: hypothetical protein EYG80_01880 [Flavobacteriaceae bacterium]|nr:hypothetical protein [Flavobacteriaceae bacterium]
MNCNFCASPLAPHTLVCSYCNQRNPLPKPISQEALKEQEVKKYHCAECKTQTLNYIELGGMEKSISVMQCQTCQGIFISKKILDEVIFLYGWKRKNVHSKIEVNLKEKVLSTNQLYTCPICQHTMKRETFKISSNVLIDECPKHGIWLNHGELRMLVEWKKSLKESRNKETQEENYRKYGLKKTKSNYTYQKNYSSKFERLFEWLMGV